MVGHKFGAALKLNPIAISKASLETLEQRGLIRCFRPTEGTLHPPEADNRAESLYESAPQYGPHKLIAVGVNKTTVRLGLHPDNEEFLIPDHGADTRPVYLVIAHLAVEDLRKRDSLGTLSGNDFSCLSLYPAPRGAEMFTMLAGTVHCEITDASARPIGCFFVTESRDLPITWIDLERTNFQVG